MPDNPTNRIRQLIKTARHSISTTSSILDRIEEELQAISGERASHKMRSNQASKPLRLGEGEPKPVDKKKLLTVKEAAVVLGVHRVTVHRQIALGKIQICKIGRSTRIPKKELDRFIESNLKGVG